MNSLRVVVFIGFDDFLKYIFYWTSLWRDRVGSDHQG
jgi:hypothetical protein